MITEKSVVFYEKNKFFYEISGVFYVIKKICYKFAVVNAVIDKLSAVISKFFAVIRKLSTVFDKLSAVIDKKNTVIVKFNTLFDKLLRDKLGEFSVGLAPMDDITTTEFRNICKNYGADILITEFVAADAIIRNVEKSFHKIKFSDNERPIGIQLFGSSKEVMVEAAQRVESLNPDFIDLNWGCPMRKIADKQAGSGILLSIDKMIDITKAVVKSVRLPVSIKTRIGYSEKHTHISDFCEELQDCGIQLLTIHGRYKQQLYKGSADWNEISKVKNNPRIKIPIFGNGDIDSPHKMLEYRNRYGVDGILIGRYAIGRPYIFKQCHQLLKNENLYQPTIQEIVKIVQQHLDMMVANHGEFRAITVMKKFYSKYFNSIPDFKQTKLQLMTAKSQVEVVNILNKIINS